MTEQTCVAVVREDEVDRFEGVPLMHPTYCGLPIRFENGEWEHYRRIPIEHAVIGERFPTVNAGHPAQPAAEVQHD